MRKCCRRRFVVLIFPFLVLLLIWMLINRSGNEKTDMDIPVAVRLNQEYFSDAWLSYKFNLLDGTDDWLRKLAAVGAECTLGIRQNHQPSSV